VKQLADGDDADRPFLVADEGVKGRGVRSTLAIDEDVGIDQDGQTSSGGPTDARTFLTSSAKSESIGGAACKRSRNRRELRKRVLGGESTATAAPLRVISISSPAATRFRTSEKLRAASVAEMRATSWDDI
jgi:hypothetical protein